MLPERFPAWERLPNEQAIADEIFGDRVRLLKKFQSAQAPKLVLCSIQSLLQPVPDRDALGRQTRCLGLGQQSRIEDLARWLVENGFHNTPAVELPGEFSIRGGILDIFAPDWFDPVRIEFFGDEIESIRRFEVSSQRSLERLESVEVTILPPGMHDRGHLADYLPAQSWFMLVEPMELKQQAEHYLERLERPEEMHDFSAVTREIFRFPSVAAWAVAAGSMETTCRLMIESVERFSGDINKVREELDDAGTGQEVFIVCQTEAEARRLDEIFAGTQLARQGHLHFHAGFAA